MLRTGSSKPPLDSAPNAFGITMSTAPMKMPSPLDQAAETHRVDGPGLSIVTDSGSTEDSAVDSSSFLTPRDGGGERGRGFGIAAEKEHVVVVSPSKRVSNP